VNVTSGLSGGNKTLTNLESLNPKAHYVP